MGGSAGRAVSSVAGSAGSAGQVFADVLRGKEEDRQKKQADALAAEQARAQQDLLKQQEDRLAKEQADQLSLDAENQASEEAGNLRKRQKLQALEKKGRRGTILTSPLGTPGGETTGRTLIGG